MRPHCHCPPLALIALLCLLALSATPLSAVNYEKDIVPIFEAKCEECHSADLEKPKGGFVYDDLAKMKREIGPERNIIPGNWDESWLYVVLSRPQDDRDAMPPEDKGDRLTDAELTLVRDWIEAGADLERGRAASASGGDDDDGSALDRMSSGAPVAYREWINAAGKSITAVFVELDGDIVVLRMDDGKEYRYPMDKLSPESQALAQSLGAEAKSTGTE